MSQELNYLKLTGAVAGGIVIGCLTLWLASTMLAFGLLNAFVTSLDFRFGDLPRSSVPAGARYEEQQKAQRKSLADRRQRDIKLERGRSALGQELWRQCDEWSANYKRTPTQTVKLQGRFFCDRYARYIETGSANASAAPILETRTR